MELHKFDLSLELERRLWEASPFTHPDLDLVNISGSFGQKSNGALSDLDVLTVLKPEQPDLVDTNALVNLARQLREWAHAASQLIGVQPVVISTIRLEEAQVALAKRDNRPVLPIHWLCYPSVEFAAVNEPQELFLNLLAGKTLWGNPEQTKERFKVADAARFQALAGLDWLTDSFRVLVANIDPETEENSFQPPGFLKSLAMHNLEYFWKWRIVAGLASQMGEKFMGWQQLEQLPIQTEIKDLARRIREVRHQGDRGQLAEIIALHKLTFSLWAKHHQAFMMASNSS